MQKYHVKCSEKSENVRAVGDCERLSILQVWRPYYDPRAGHEI